MDGAEIRGLRKQLDLTQEQFAHEIGVTFATVNRWENNKSKPSRLALKALSELRAKTKGSSRGRSGRSRRKR
ncbi:MAG: helix-turn-helix domain-containing protein [Planctomycetota bacterium]